jgi:HSP20 family protein
MKFGSAGEREGSMAETITKVPVKSQAKPPETAAEPSAKTPAETAAAPAGEGVWQTLTNLRQELDRVFDDFSRRVTLFPFGRRVFDWEPFVRLGAVGRGVAPIVDVIEREGAFEVTAELPGLDQKDIEVTLSESVLTIQGEKREEREEKGESHCLSERRFGAFRRTFQLPRTVDADKVTASFENGALRIALPKKPEAMTKERKIEIAAK